MNDNRRRIQGKAGLGDRHCLALLAIVTAALFRKALFAQGVILSHPIFLDLTHHIYPWRLFGFGLLKKGVVPLWNPYLFCGVPFAANWHSAIFYPPNAIFLFMPVYTALNWSIACHFFLAGALTYAFVKLLLGDRVSALLSALAFIFSGPVLVQLFPGHIFNPLPWLPLSLLLAELAVRRRRLVYYVIGGCVLALQVLAGHPQYMLYCVGAVVMYLFFRAIVECRAEGSLSPMRMVCAGVVVMLVCGAALSAVQLIPSWEFKNHSSRALLRGPESVSEISLPPENLVTLLVPGFFGDMHGSRYWGRWLLWETCLYLGILPLILAAAGAVLSRDRPARFFTLLAAVSLVLAFGAYSPLFGVLYRLVPGFALFRGQAKFISITAFSLAVLAGYGCRTVIASGPDKARPLSRLAVAFIAAGAALAVLCLTVHATGGTGSPLWAGLLRYRQARGFQGTPPLHPAEGKMFLAAYRVALKGAATSAFWLLVSGSVLLAAAAGRLRRPALMALILAVSIADLWWYGSKYIMVSPLSSCRWPRGLEDFMKGDQSIFRICAPNIAVPGANQNMNAGICSIDGYETTNVAAYKEYVDFAQGVDSESRLTFAVDEVTPMLEALNLKYVILPADKPFARPGYRWVFSDGRETVYEKGNVSPRAYIVHDFEVARDDRDALARLREGGRESVVLMRDPGIAPLGGGGKGRPSQAEITAISPNEVSIRAELTRPGFLVLTDVDYPGWKAYIDGRERPILRADYAFRAVCLDAGNHRVTFRYEPSSFRWGAWLSVFSAAAVALYLASRASRGL